MSMDPPVSSEGPQHPAAHAPAPSLRDRPGWKNRERRIDPRAPSPVWVVVATVFAAPAIVLSIHRLHIPPLIAIILFTGTLYMLIAWFGLRLSRAQKLVKQHHRFLCVNCLYALEGLPEEGHCPECDEPYTRAGLWKMWREWEQATNKGKLLIPDPPKAPDQHS